MTATPPFQLELDEHAKLVLKRPGEDDAGDVVVRRAFPWSKPDEFISIRSAEGKELVLIESLADVPADLRALIERHLSGTIFIPKITRVDERNKVPAQPNHQKLINRRTMI